MESSKWLSDKHSAGQINQTLLVETAFLLVVVVWGVTFVFSKQALEIIGPFAYNTIRMMVGAVTLAVLAGKRWKSVNRTYAWPALITGFILFASYASQAYGQQFTTASKAGFLTGTNLVYVPVFSAILLHQKPNKMAVFGVILAFTGLVLLSVEGSLGELALAPGDFWVALSGIGWALYIIVLARYSPALNVMTYAALHVLVAALLSGVGWLFLEPLSVPVTSLALWVGVFTTGFLVIGLGTSVQTWVTRVASPTRVALISAMEPVFAAMAGWWIGEPVTPRIIIGGALILTGMLVSEMTHLRTPSFRQARE